MSSIDYLNATPTEKPIKSFKDLVIGEYPVRNFRIVKTKYGKPVRFEMEDCVMFLPDRYTMNADQITDANNRTVTISYLGRDAKNRVLLKFNDKSPPKDE